MRSGKEIEKFITLTSDGIQILARNFNDVGSYYLDIKFMFREFVVE